MGENELDGIHSIVKSDGCYKIKYVSGELAQLSVMNNHVFRYYVSPTGVFLNYPVPNNKDDKAKITEKQMEDYDKKAFIASVLSENIESYEINTGKITITLDKAKSTMQVYDKRTKKLVLNEVQPLTYSSKQTKQTLSQGADEYFFGGGMQNGRFSHKGKVINIVNENGWNDGEVTSPCPFYWSSYGYGVLRNTWQPGEYDFSAANIEICHEDTYFDAFYFINPRPADILKDYFELTGQPILLPEYAFYEAYFNAFNCNNWVKVKPGTEYAILYEDGYYYKKHKSKNNDNNTGILESLNGEKNNYQFSARAMIDRYKKHDMPLGWFIPNDGYGCGYGQTDSLDGDIENVRQFQEYAKANGVEVALWTESNLTPADVEHPKKGERDLAKEVGKAGVVALKCDVKWIGDGYSFALNAVENAASIFKKHRTHNQRLFILMVDGWAGTQRYAGIWTGDQSGGEWENIRFHIPTLIGSGLSGQPVVGSDLDGIYHGGDKHVNIRDFQWKTFTPLQLNMDGWGNIRKTPFSFDEEATEINRFYLKLKSVLMPYNYSISYETLLGLPMIRAMLLEYPTDIYAHTSATQYQFMWGPSLLIAPVYYESESGIDTVRDEIYLPDEKQVWIDFFTGEKYKGGRVLNNFSTPLWKIPIFVRDGGIIPITNPNNNPSEIIRTMRKYLMYPDGETNFDVYEDDGISSDFLNKKFASTHITVHGPRSNENGQTLITINKTKGNYEGMVYEKNTIIQIMSVKHVHSIKAVINDTPLELKNANSKDDYDNNTNVYYIEYGFEPLLKVNSYFDSLKENPQHWLLIKLQKVDVTMSDIQLKFYGNYHMNSIFGNHETSQEINTPVDFKSVEENTTAHSIALQWSTTDAEYYEIEKDGIIFTNITGNQHVFHNLESNSQSNFRIRSIKNTASAWSDVITIKTKNDPIIKVENVKCSIPCQPHQEIHNVVSANPSWWHTQWDMPDQACVQQSKVITLSFDLGKIYAVDKFVYIPRRDAGNGTFLQIKYKTSEDESTWSEYSDIVKFDHNSKTKTVDLKGIKFRYFELTVLETVGGFGSGRQIAFYELVQSNIV